jgi:purine nucleosidase
VQAVTVFHDPLAAVTIFDPSVCAFERGDVEVVREGGEAGRTLWKPYVKYIV